MQNNKKISVVVPAYRRPKYIEDLIRSYLVQDYHLTNADAELVIVDDSGDNNEVQAVVQNFSKTNSSIRYIKNEVNIGFCKNLLKAIISGEGNYIVILGDDDMFVKKNAITRYVHEFEANPDVDFIYSNQIQFNSNFKADYIYEHFKNDAHYRKGEDSLKNIWLLSCFISGIGLRKNQNFVELYPEELILFPQVEFIGKILLKHDSKAVSEFLIGSRAHNEQLGFKAVKGKDIKKNEKHSVYELEMVYNKVVEYAKLHNIPLDTDKDFVNDFFADKHMTIFPSEKINTGNKAIITIFLQAVKNDYKNLFKPMFIAYFLISILLPANILFWLKEKAKEMSIKKYPNEINQFNNFAKTLYE